jgi:hypothetical protein
VAAVVSAIHLLSDCISIVSVAGSWQVKSGNCPRTVTWVGQAVEPACPTDKKATGPRFPLRGRCLTGYSVDRNCVARHS